MRTAALTLLLASAALAQSPAQPVPPASPNPPAPAFRRPVVIAPKPGDIAPQAQAVLERATAAYRACKTYRETVLTRLEQRVSGIAKDAEPPADQASQTSLVWAGPDRFTFDNRDFSLYRNGAEAAILVKSLGQYVQRPPNDEDKGVFGNMVDLHPVYQALIGATDGAGAAGTPPKPDKSPFGRLLTAQEARPEELRSVKGKRVVGSGLPPLPGMSTAVPVTMFFADDTGLLMQATYDMRAAMQAQYDRSYSDMKAAGQQTGPKATIQRFVITQDWTSAKADPTGDDAVNDGATNFTPRPGDVKVDQFNIADGDDSVQHRLIGKPAPDFSTTTLDGKPWSLKDQRGKVVLLQFWSASAPRSVASLTIFNSMDIHYKEQKADAVIVGVNQDHPVLLEQSKATAAAKMAAYPMLADGDKAIGNALRVAVLPCTILIDKEGVVRSITTDFDAADQVLVAGRIDRLLAGRPIEDEPRPAPFQLPSKPGTPAPAAPAMPAPPPAPPAAPR
ncbi:MAG: peroxiredoxin family protein [Phycisphaerales bacterium]|nr:peroxiredoxin family protein [Phycisphaerales bacterium]